MFWRDHKDSGFFVEACLWFMKASPVWRIHSWACFVKSCFIAFHFNESTFKREIKDPPPLLVSPNADLIILKTGRKLFSGVSFKKSSNEVINKEKYKRETGEVVWSEITVHWHSDFIKFLSLPFLFNLSVRFLLLFRFVIALPNATTLTGCKPRSCYDYCREETEAFISHPIGMGRPVVTRTGSRGTRGKTLYKLKRLLNSRRMIHGCLEL